MIEVKIVSLNEHRRLASPMFVGAGGDFQSLHHGDFEGVTQYVGREIYEKMIFVPVGAFVDGVFAGTQLSYNISDEAVYTVSHYVLPKFRKMGLSTKMRKFSQSFWPKSFKFLAHHTTSSFVKMSNIISTASPVPGHTWSAPFVGTGNRTVLDRIEFLE